MSGKPFRSKAVLFSLLFIVHSLSYSQDYMLLSIPELIDSGQYYINSDTKKSREFYDKALVGAETVGIDSLISEIYMHLGVLSRKKGNLSDAMLYHQKAFTIDYTRGDSASFATHWHNIAVVFRFMKEYDSAMNYMRKAIEIRELLKDSLSIAASYSQMGVLYRKKNDLDTAFLFYNKALSIFKKIENIDEAMHTNGNIAVLHYKNKAYQKSIDLNLEAVAYFEKTDNNSSLASRYSSLGRAFDKLEKRDLAILYMTKSIKIAKKENYTQMLSNFYKIRSKMYRDIQDYKSALEDYRMFKKYNDKVFNIESIKKIERSIMNLELSQQSVLDSMKYDEKEQQHQFTISLERKRNNLYQLFLLLLLTATGFIYYILSRKKKFFEMMHLNKKLETDILEKDLKLAAINVQHYSNEYDIKISYLKSLAAKVKQIQKSNDKLEFKKGLNGLGFELQRQINGHNKKNMINKLPLNTSKILEQKLVSHYPSLTKGEREVCLYIYAKMSTKEIMEIKGGSETSIRSMRYRIRKKMDLKKKDELERFIIDLFLN